MALALEWEVDSICKRKEEEEEIRYILMSFKFYSLHII